MKEDNGKNRGNSRLSAEGARRRDVLGAIGLAGFISSVPAATRAMPIEVSEASKLADDGLREKINNVVVVFAENRSFNNLFGNFPGVKLPLKDVPASTYRQRDRDGSILDNLPKIWGGLVPQEQVVNHQTYHISETAINGLPNRPFALTTPEGEPLPQGVVTRDLVHTFYQNQMQINGGKNDGFVAWGDSGALVLGHYADNGVNLRLWAIAREYTLCDNFFMGAFGGSFLNHQYLVASRPPFYPDADKSPAEPLIATMTDGDPEGIKLTPGGSLATSCMDGPAQFVNSAMSPDFFVVNTMSPPYAPTMTRDGKNPAYGDPNNSRTLPPQMHATIGDRLSEKGVGWAWYSGGWGLALSGQPDQTADFPSRPKFQDHHQPFNYFKRFAPGTVDREQHLRDGGFGDTSRTNRFLADVEAGTLPAVAYYKPQGNLNMHAGYSDVDSGDRHITNIISALRNGPQWQNMLVVITFDENGGWWDHVPPPAGDRWGPGTRVPTLIISPFAKRGYVDHTVYDTGSISRFLIRRFGLDTLAGLQEREAAMLAASGVKPGDLTNALDLA